MPPSDGEEELAILRKKGAGDLNVYYYKKPVPGDWTYWDAASRNPSPLARDFWIVPSGNAAVGIMAVRIE